MVTIKQIEEFCQRIAEKFQPIKILLFGSYATGKTTVHSDVDILVILPFDGKPIDKSLEILNETKPEFAIDLLTRNPEDTERRYIEGDPLIRDAIDNGVVMYE